MFGPTNFSLDAVVLGNHFLDRICHVCHLEINIGCQNCRVDELERPPVWETPFDDLVALFKVMKIMSKQVNTSCILKYAFGKRFDWKIRIHDSYLS